MPRLPKAKLVPPSSFSEPSEPSQVRPEDKPAATLRGEQEKNPQLIAHERGRQSGDAKGPHAGAGAAEGGKGEEEGGVEKREAERVVEDEGKRNEVVGAGFGMKGGAERSKL